MTKEEIEIMESVRLWIMVEARNSDSSLVRREANKLADAIDDIIRKYSDS